MANLLEDIQCAGSDTRPHMLDRGKENEVNILKSIDEGPFQMGKFWETIVEGNEGALHLGPERPRVYSDLSPEDKERYNADIWATNILLQGLPKDIYSLINHYTDAKDIWDSVKMLLEGSELTKEDRKSQLMGRFVTAVKLNRGLRDSNYDQLYAYLKKHEAHADENKMMLKRFTQPNVDPLALMSNVSHQQYNSQSSTNPSSTYIPPHFADNSQLDSRLSPMENLIENLTNTLALLTQSYKTYLPQTNNQLRTSSNPKNQATFQEGRVLVQNVQGQQNRGHGYNARGAGLRRMGVSLDEEQLLFLASGQDNVVDEDVDEQPVQDLALNVDNVFQADDCDAFDSDVDEAPTVQTMFMANLSSTDAVYDKDSSSYDLDVLSEVYDNDHYQDAVCEHHEIHEMHDDVQPNYVVDSHADDTSDSNMIPYDQYVKDNTVPVVQNNVSSVPNDAYMMILNDIYESSAQCVSVTSQNNVVDNSLSAELATYKEQVELYERRVRFELTEREQKIDEQLRIVITDRNIKEENLKKELHSVKMQLASTINHNKSMVEEVTSLKKDFKQKENKYLEEFLDMKALKEKNKVAIGYKNPLCLTRAKQVQPALYNGYEIIKNNHVPAIVHNTEDTLEIAEITRRKINDKMKDPECVTHKSQDLIKMKEEALKKQTIGSRPIKELTMYPPNTPATLVPRVLLTKKVIPFFKTLKEHFEGIQKPLTKKIKEMKDIFEELEAEVDQNVINRKHDEIEWKNLLIVNDNLIVYFLSKEVFYIAMNSGLTVSRFTEMHEAHTIVQTRCLEL
ncbi:hypothetical protein Tco_0872958 [Tanacetum coccineum]